MVLGKCWMVSRRCRRSQEGVDGLGKVTDGLKKVLDGLRKIFG